ncbi:response regulator [Aquibacillus sp. 3ASR75-11]|uniref:Response regulator n=1 Tax=Terrihalobacillus insolitus TaxID=2950438 RepID=A0A9X3WUY0_9BACI|nr:response regulator [Terrihalobacillus insolitus]MDC3425058.1 response regulator [Terrihalobacillus insolitus]
MKKKVMIVDDQPGIRLLLEEVLKNEGYEIITAENGKQALDKVLTTEPPDLIIIDYKLPIMDGSTVIKELDARGIKTSVIIMSGLAEEAIREKDNFDMVKDVFAKPFNIEDARETIKKIVEASD